MKTMKELRNESPDYRALYHLNYWDGPLSGVCLWNGKKQYFNAMHEDMNSYMEEWPEWERYCKENDIDIYEDDDGDEKYYYTHRVFLVYETPGEIMDIIQENHDLFRKHVGTHTDYNEDGHRGQGARISLRADHPEDIGNLRPYSEHDKFYKSEKKQAKMDLKNWEILGKFMSPF
jgi:hypothetical protein